MKTPEQFQEKCEALFRPELHEDTTMKRQPGLVRASAAPLGIALRGVALAMLGSFGAQAEDLAGTPAGLQPYQMVRSLELVQDRIAGGDHAALPMQKKLLELIDGRFRGASAAEFSERRNFDALMIYAMSGGNPTTVEVSLAGLALDEADRAAADGLLGYLAGDVAGARAAMASVEPSAHTQEVAAFLALVKGSVVAGEDARAGIALLDRARLLAPGSLVEEAALRRTLALAVMATDPERFLRASEQYSRRFLRSPYAAQFAETFVSGILTLKDSLDLAQVEQAIAWMTPEQAKTVYLRLARRAAIDGDARLLAFASQRVVEDGQGAPEGLDPRSELYSSISSVTSETVDEVLTRLIELDASKLSASDRALLDAARAIATEVVAPARADLPAALPADAAIAGDAPAEPARTAETDAPTGPADAAGQPDPLVLSARARLEEIDKMLEESEQ